MLTLLYSDGGIRKPIHQCFNFERALYMQEDSLMATF